ncbi:MAG: 7-carboxy-7-deazaguanine synthase QueE [Flavobacteriales bacterium]|nr:7-carboxy-7-deazaguanine synthase QueE [Flavobacteriales bacterium]
MDATTLPLMEHFYSLQGEGYHTGQAAYFLRLGGCDVECTWCDVKDSWDPSFHPKVSIDNMTEWVMASGAKNCVITGGEPCMHNLQSLISALKRGKIQVWLETSGTHPISGTPDWICFSPKKFKQPLAPIYQQADELKIVVYHKSDLNWATEHAKHVKKTCLLYLQPEWSKKDQILPLLIPFIKENPHWQLSLQIHKYLSIP